MVSNNEVFTNNSTISPMTLASVKEPSDQKSLCMFTNILEVKIKLEHFSALLQTEINSSIKSCPHNAVFNYFLSDNNKQDAATTTAHIKHLIELFKKKY